MHVPQKLNIDIVHILKKLWSVVVTLWLFNQSDMKTIVLPITVFSQALATSHSLRKLFVVVLWIWLDLLQITVSNQSFGDSPNEDAANKPNRPIPSKRITLQSARLLRWSLIPIDLFLSTFVGAFPAGLCITAMTAIYNELGGHNHWLTKNGCCAVFYAAFEYGATGIADTTVHLSPTQLAAVMGSALIIFTTIHAQDFRDDEGDAVLGRSTFSLAYPTIARISMPTMLIGWSIALLFLSNIHAAVLYGLVCMSILVGVRFMLYKTAAADRFSYLLYNLWLCTAHVALSGLDLEKIRSVAQLVPLM